MFNNVLIAEDHESANLSVQKTLQDLGIREVSYAFYCDDALLRLQRGLESGNPYELLITDLSFEDDGREQRITTGKGLIAAAKGLQPNLKVLVFSAEYKPAVLQELVHQLGINGYVKKARRDAQELKTAIENISNGKKHFPSDFRQDARQLNAHNFTAYDITIIKLLSGGMLQKNIPAYLQQAKSPSASLSSVEKRLCQVRDALGFVKNEQLVAYCKDKGII